MVLLWQMLLDKSSTAAAMREQQGFKSQQKLQDREDNKQANDVDLREKSSKEGGAENCSSQLLYLILSQEARCLFIFNKDAPQHSQCKGCGAKGAFNCSIAKHILTKRSSTGLRQYKLGQQHKTTTKPIMARLNRQQEIIVINVIPGQYVRRPSQWTPSGREKLTPIIGCYVPPLENALNAGQIFGQLKARKWQKDKNCRSKLIMGFKAKMVQNLEKNLVLGFKDSVARSWEISWSNPVALF